MKKSYSKFLAFIFVVTFSASSFCIQPKDNCHNDRKIATLAGVIVGSATYVSRRFAVPVIVGLVAAYHFLPEKDKTFLDNKCKETISGLKEFLKTYQED